MEAWLKHWRQLVGTNKKLIDAQLTLFGPFFCVPILLGYMMGVYNFISPDQLDILPNIVGQSMMLLTIATILLTGIALAHAVKPRKTTDLLWVFPFVYIYGGVQAFIALRALIQTLLKRPRLWTKTRP